MTDVADNDSFNFADRTTIGNGPTNSTNSHAFPRQFLQIRILTTSVRYPNFFQRYRNDDMSILSLPVIAA